MFLQKQRLDWELGFEDESIFQHENKPGKVWAVKGSKPRSKVTGSKKKVICFGTLTESKQQCFRTYPKANSDYFITYLKVLLQKFKKLILFVDQAPWHKSKKVKNFLSHHKHRLKIKPLPKGFPELNPVEESWRQGKKDIQQDQYYDSFEKFSDAVSLYYRNKRFKLDVYKYFC